MKFDKNMKKRYLFLAILIIVVGTALIAGAWSWYLDFKEADKSLSNIKKRGVIVVGSDIPYGAMEFFDENNQPAGVDVDIAKEIAAHLGVTLKFNDYNWDELFLKAKQGEIDLAISAITITPQRQQQLLFSDSYFTGGQVILVRSEDDGIKGINDLAGKKIAVQADTTSYSEAKKYTSEDYILSYADFGSSGGGGIINDLKNKKFEAIIVDYIQALDLIKNDPQLKIIGVPFTQENYGIVMKVGNNLLATEINFILKEMEADGHLQEIKTKWMRY